MDLLEYQAKELFSQVGIPVLPSQSISDPSELKHLHISYPIVLKSQVLASGRAKLGGVRFVENTIDAIAVAQSLFNLAIEGEYPQVILAESRYDVENEIFLGVMFDYVLKKPVLMGSSHGGIHLDSLLANLQTCVIEEEFLPFHARHLVMKMGLQARAIAPVTAIIEKMYDLFLSHDLDLIEINPLGLNNNTEVMALDGKIRVNDESLNRHPHLLKYLTTEQSLQKNYSALEINSEGDLVIISDSIDQAIFALNHLQSQKKVTQSIYIVKKKNEEFWLKNIRFLLEDISQNKSLKKVIINHSNTDKFVNVLIQEIIKEHQSENHRQELLVEDRAERATGTRLWYEPPKNREKSKTFLVHIHWTIRHFPSSIFLDENSLKSLPITLNFNWENMSN